MDCMVMKSEYILLLLKQFILYYFIAYAVSYHPPLDQTVQKYYVDIYELLWHVLKVDICELASFRKIF